MYQFETGDFMSIHLMKAFANSAAPYWDNGGRGQVFNFLTELGKPVEGRLVNTAIQHTAVLFGTVCGVVPQPILQMVAAAEYAPYSILSCNEGAVLCQPIEIACKDGFYISVRLQEHLNRKLQSRGLLKMYSVDRADQTEYDSVLAYIRGNYNRPRRVNNSLAWAIVTPP